MNSLPGPNFFNFLNLILDFDEMHFELLYKESLCNYNLFFKQITLRMLRPLRQVVARRRRYSVNSTVLNEYELIYEFVSS